MLPEGFKVFSGDDPIALPVIAVGGAGLVSVASNQIPAEMARMTSAALADEWESAREINRKYFRSDAGEFLGDESRTGEGGAGHDGPDRGEVPASDSPGCCGNAREAKQVGGAVGIAGEYSGRSKPSANGLASQ